MSWTPVWMGVDECAELEIAECPVITSSPGELLLGHIGMALAIEASS